MTDKLVKKEAVKKSTKKETVKKVATKETVKKVAKKETTKKVAKKPVVKRKPTTHICSGCIVEFDKKELFIGEVPEREYSTFYCKPCLEKFKVTVFRPCVKERVAKVKTEEVKPKNKKATK
jgi:hypothetical protein